MNQIRFIKAVSMLFCLLFSGTLQMNADPNVSSLEGIEIELFGDETTKIAVVLFVAVECPISNRFAPAVNRIYDDFESSEFAMWTVYTDDLFTTEEIAQHRTDYQYRMPALVDFDRTLAKYCGATVTPEAVVFIRDESKQFRMAYRGRVNNQYVDFGKWRLKPTKQDLREVLTAIRKGKGNGIVFVETEAIGCYIGE